MITINEPNLKYCGIFIFAFKSVLMARLEAGVVDKNILYKNFPQYRRSSSSVLVYCLLFATLIICGKTVFPMFILQILIQTVLKTNKIAKSGPSYQQPGHLQF